MMNEFYYLKIIKGYDEEYFICPHLDFKMSPMGMKIFDDVEDAIDYKRWFFERHKRTLNLKLSDIQLSDIQVCRL